MATFNVYIAPESRTIDQKYKVCIRITQYRKHAYLSTGFYVVRQQLNKEMKLKDKHVLKTVLDKIEECENTVLQELGNKASSYTAQQLKIYLETKFNTITYINFIDFARQYIKDLLEEGEKAKKDSGDRNKKEKRAKHIQTTINAFEDKFGKTFDITSLQSETLKEFEKHLRSRRIIVRINQFGNEVKIKREPLTNTGIHDYMVDIQTVFNAACKKYNKKSQGIVIIHNNPFEEYKIPKANSGITQNKNAEIAKIRRIFEYKGEGRAKLGRDCYMLSFFMAGINSVDLYEAKYSCLENERFAYNRSKTEDRRPDNAFISIKIEPEAQTIMEQYKDSLKKRAFLFYRMYANSDGFNAAINIGLKKMREDINTQIDKEIAEEKIKELNALKIGKSLTYYSARHSWATIVRNELGYSTHIIAECLNHSVDTLKVTDRYIKKEFTWIDEINRKVIDYVLYGKAGE